MMPWRGFVPTHRRLVTVTQTLWLVVALLVVNAALFFLNLPHVPLDGLMRNNLPRLHIRVVGPSNSVASVRR